MDVGQKMFHAVLHLVPAKSGGGRGLGQGCVPADAGSGEWQGDRALSSKCLSRIAPLPCSLALFNYVAQGQGGAVRAKHLLNPQSPRHPSLQDIDTACVVAPAECRMTRRSLNNRFWAESWEVQRVLYAEHPETGEKKAS